MLNSDGASVLGACHVPRRVPKSDCNKTAETDCVPRVTTAGSAAAPMPAALRPSETDCMAEEAVRSEPVCVRKFHRILGIEAYFSLQFGQMQGDFDKMQGGDRQTPAKNRPISITSRGFSLLKEQGG